MFGLFKKKPKDPNKPGLSPVQRIIGVGANMLFPGAGIATNAMFNYRNNNTVGGIYNGYGSGYNGADRAAINGPSMYAGNLGLGSQPDFSQYSGYGSSQQPGSSTTNQQLYDSLGQYADQMQQQRIASAGGSAPMQSQPAPQMNAPRHENALGYSNMIRNMGGSNAFEGMDTWMANHDVKERTRGMVR